MAFAPEQGLLCGQTLNRSGPGLLPGSDVCVEHWREWCSLGENMLALGAGSTKILGSSLFPSVSVFPVGLKLSDRRKEPGSTLGGWDGLWAQSWEDS